VDPASTEPPLSSARKRPKPAVAIAAVAVPLLAIIIAAAVTTSRSDESSATATTISQSGDPAAAGKKDGSASSDGGTTETTAKDGSDGGKGKTTTTTEAPADDPEIPSTPIDAGPEGERTAVTYPQPTVPASGCSRPKGTAVITLTSAPSPACLELDPDQPVIVRNRTGREITFVAISVNEVIAAGSEMRVGTARSAFGDGQSTFWSPGNPKLSGIVRVG